MPACLKRPRPRHHQLLSPSPPAKIFCRRKPPAALKTLQFTAFSLVKTFGANNSDHTSQGTKRKVRQVDDRIFVTDTQSGVSGSSLAQDQDISNRVPTEPDHSCGIPSQHRKRRKTSREMLQGMSPQKVTGSYLDPKFNSFNYWKPTLPDINDELADLVEEPMQVDGCLTTREEPAAFNSFNYWKNPVATLDLPWEFDL